MDEKKAYDSVDHGWLVEMMHMHKFPRWLCKAIHNLCMCWNTRIVAKTEKACSIRFNRGLLQGDSLCPRLFTLCINPVAWKLKATEGYRLSKPINTSITHLLYIDDLKV